MENHRSAILLGATGLVGNFVLRHLLEDPLYHKVICLNRTKIELLHPKFEQHLVDFDKPETWNGLLHGDELFCCLGTTLRKAGSVKAFRKVDHDIPLVVAKAAACNGVGQILLVSSVGANLGSSNYYLRAKGELEEAIKTLPFQAIHIFRPSFLLGKRKDFRFGELIMKKLAAFLSPMVPRRWGKYKAINAENVAKAMISKSKEIKHGTHVYHYHEMMR